MTGYFAVFLCLASIFLIITYPALVIIRIKGDITVDINFVFLAISLRKRKTDAEKKEDRKEGKQRPKLRPLVEKLISISKVEIAELALPCPDGIYTNGIFNAVLSVLIAYIDSKAKKLTLRKNGIEALSKGANESVSIHLRCRCGMIRGFVTLLPTLIRSRKG